MPRFIVDILRDISLGEEQISVAQVKLDLYVKCFIEWALTHNITATSTTAENLWENIYDSLALAKLFPTLFAADKMADIVDVGTGGGLPGLPLAIVFPRLKFHLVDSDRKKCSFLRMMKAKLAMSNVEIVNKTLKALPALSFMVTKAAFSPVNSGELASALAEGGRLALWATPQNQAEFSLQLAKGGLELLEGADYVLPQGKKRSLLVFTKI